MLASASTRARARGPSYAGQLFQLRSRRELPGHARRWRSRDRTRRASRPCSPSALGSRACVAPDGETGRVPRMSRCSRSRGSRTEAEDSRTTRTSWRPNVALTIGPTFVWPAEARVALTLGARAGRPPSSPTLRGRQLRFRLHGSSSIGSNRWLACSCRRLAERPTQAARRSPPGCSGHSRRTPSESCRSGRWCRSGCPPCRRWRRSSRRVSPGVATPRASTQPVLPPTPS